MKLSKVTPERMGRWTRSEIQKLQRVYGSKTPEQVARIFNRSVASTERQAERWRLATDKVFVRRQQGRGVYKMPRWAPAEVKLIRRIYSNLSNLAVARRLQRSIGSVVSQANKLGLHKSARRMEGMGRENIRGIMAERKKAKSKKSRR